MIQETNLQLHDRRRSGAEKVVQLRVTARGSLADTIGHLRRNSNSHSIDSILLSNTIRYYPNPRQTDTDSTATALHVRKASSATSDLPRWYNTSGCTYRVIQPTFAGLKRNCYQKSYYNFFVNFAVYILNHTREANIIIEKTDAGFNGLYIRDHFCTPLRRGWGVNTLTFFCTPPTNLSW